MKLHISQDYEGNIYITDDVDSLSPQAYDYTVVTITDYKRHTLTGDPTMYVDIQDYSEIISIKREGLAIDGEEGN